MKEEAGTRRERKWEREERGSGNRKREEGGTGRERQVRARLYLTDIRKRDDD